MPNFLPECNCNKCRQKCEWGKCRAFYGLFHGPIIGDEATQMLEGVRFFWTATRGHRLRPWRSQYLKWRLETFTGKHAEEVSARDFWRFVVAERRQLLRFLLWLSEMRSYAIESDRE